MVHQPRSPQKSSFSDDSKLTNPHMLKAGGLKGLSWFQWSPTKPEGPYPQNPHAIYSASLRRYRKPRKITVAGPSISEATKRKNPKIRGKRSQGLSQAKLSLQHRGIEHVRARKTHCLQQVSQDVTHTAGTLFSQSSQPPPHSIISPTSPHTPPRATPYPRQAPPTLPPGPLP